MTPIAEETLDKAEEVKMLREKLVLVREGRKEGGRGGREGG
jgi:hypothetical protein